MQIIVNITLAEDDAPLDSAEVAAKVFEAVGGDDSKDMCTVMIQAAPETSQIQPPPPEMPPPPEPPAEFPS